MMAVERVHAGAEPSRRAGIRSQAQRYPPDLQDAAVQNVLQQAEALSVSGQHRWPINETRPGNNLSARNAAAPSSCRRPRPPQVVKVSNFKFLILALAIFRIFGAYRFAAAFLSRCMAELANKN
jgi:hypothetical protein